ncbi:MAG: MBL fold metallo-hydrolase, partial [Vicinamibacteria bacterium]
LVDTGPDVTGASVMQALQRARVGLRSLRAILLTGGDGDAAGGASTLRDRSGARVLCSREEGAKLHPFEPDGYLIAGDVVEKHIEVVPAPSRGRLAFLFRPDRALFTGDAPIESFLELAPELVLPARGPAQRGPNALMASMS